jgi:hypothetical protein
MVSLRSDLFFAALGDAKDFAKKLNRLLHNRQHSSADPRDVQRMRDELRLAREQARLTSIMHRNRIF